MKRKVKLLSMLSMLVLILCGMSVQAMEIPVTTSDDTINIIHINDVFQGNAYATFDKGESLIKILNTLALDVMTVGNSEFMLGEAALAERIKQLNYPALGANLVKGGGLFDGVEAYTVLTLGNGKRVAFIGITTGNEWGDPVEVARKYISVVQAENVDIIIGLVHLGVGESDGAPVRRLAQEIPEFDLLIDGHSHHIIDEEVNGVKIVQAGAYSSGVGVVTLNFAVNGITNIAAQYYATEDFADQKVKADTQAATENLLNKYSESMSEGIGYTDVFLEATREIIRTRETNMGNVFADAMRLYTGADIGVIPSGLVGGDVGPGEITMGNIMTMARVTATVTTKTITGAQLIEALEESMSDYPAQNASMLQVSGIKLVFNPNAKSNRILSVLVGNEPVDVNKTYTIAISTNLKDIYAGIMNGTELKEWDYTYDVLAWYFKNYSPVKTEVQGRIIMASGVIKFELDGGTNHVDNNTYYINEAAVALKEPSKKGYIFDGWYSDNKFTTVITEIPVGAEGDITVYAKWIKEKAKETEKTTEKVSETGSKTANTPKKGDKFNSGKYVYKIINASTDGTGTVALIGVVKGKKVQTVNIPATRKYQGHVYKVTSIAAKAFYNNKQIKSVTISNNVTEIGKRAFEQCAKLKTVKIGNAVKVLSNKAFYKCTNLKKITIGTGLTTIGDHVFCQNKSLRNILIKSKKLTKIGKHNLYKTKNLKIKVPAGKVKAYKKIFKKQGSKNITIKK